MATLSPTKQLLYKVNLRRPVQVADLPIHTDKHKEADKMRRPTNMFKTKEQDKLQEKKLNEMKASNLLDIEVKTMIIRTFNKLRRRIDQFSENFEKEIVNIKKTKP